MTTKPPSAAEREQFEAWVLGFDKTVDLSRYSDEPAYSYRKWATQFAWHSWESARAAAVTPSPGPWHDWTGGECPVAGEVLVDVKLRNGEEHKDKAKHLYWGHFGNQWDSIAWRFAAVAPVAVSGMLISDEQSERNRHDAEELEALQMCLDEAGAPRSENGLPLSTWGRVLRLPVIEQDSATDEQCPNCLNDGCHCTTCNPAVPAIQVRESASSKEYWGSRPRARLEAAIAELTEIGENIKHLEAEYGLTATPQPEQTAITCQIYGHVVGHCADCNVGQIAQQRVERVSSNAPAVSDASSAEVVAWVNLDYEIIITDAAEAEAYNEHHGALIPVFIRPLDAKGIRDAALHDAENACGKVGANDRSDVETVFECIDAIRALKSGGVE